MADPGTEEPLKGEDPLRGEAEAQSEQTIMPWIWGGVGVVGIAIFIAWMLFSGGHRMREPPAAAPATKVSAAS